MKTQQPCLALALLAVAALLLAPTSASAGLEDQMMQHLLPPDLVMRFAEDIELSDGQRQDISTAIQETQTKATDLQWKLQAAQRELVESIAADNLDPATVENRARAVMELEQKVKLSHLLLLVHIKNSLSLAQIELIRELATTGP